MDKKSSRWSRFCHDAATLVKTLGSRISKLFDKVIYNRKASLIVSGVFAVIFCVSISFDELRFALFSSDISTLSLPNVPVEATYDAANYEVTGLPGTAELVVEGDAADLQLVRAQNSASIQVDLSGLQEGSNSVVLQASGLPNGVSATVNPDHVEVDIQKKMSKTFFITPELLVGENQNEDDFETPELSAKNVTIKATRNTLNSIRVVRAIVDTAGQDGDFTVQAPLVAYDSNGKQVNVSMSPASVTATVKMKAEDEQPQP